MAKVELRAAVTAAGATLRCARKGARENDPRGDPGS